MAFEPVTEALEDFAAAAIVVAIVVAIVAARVDVDQFVVAVKPAAIIDSASVAE